MNNYQQTNLMKLYSFIILFSAAIIPVFAQYDQSISVDGKYVPEYINHDRIGVFPKPVRFSLDKSTLQYSMAGTSADFTPQAVPVQATAWNSTRSYFNGRGYIDLGLGSWLESTLSAGYRIIDDSKTSLGVRLQHNSTSLWNPKINCHVDSRMERYDESIGIYGHRSFGKSGRLDAAFDYHLGNFNYYGFNPEILNILPNDIHVNAPTQTLNDIAARVSWNAPEAFKNISWSAGAGVRYFGYRRYYLPQSLGICKALTGGRETDFNINGSFAYKLSQKSSLGLSLNADILSYAKPEWRSEHGDLEVPTASPDSYGMISLTPYYQFSRNRLNISLGAKIDLAFNAGFENDRYGVFHIAPAIKIDYDGGPVKLFFNALGGSSLHTMAAGFESDYYQTAFLSNSTPVYSPIDAKLGLTFGPFNGFHAGFDVAFRATRGQYIGGFYQILMNSDEYFSLVSGRTYNLNGFSIGINAGYDAGKYFKIKGEGRYQKQNGTTGYFNGYDRPEWTAKVSAETNPWTTLKFKVTYELRALRKMPYVTNNINPEDANVTDLMAIYRLPNLSLLGFGASYGINRNLNVWLQADNLINRKYFYMPGLPEPGIRICVGAGYSF